MKSLLEKVDLEDGLTAGGFLCLVCGLIALFGLAVALLVAGIVMFGLGIGLAFYKGRK